MNCVVFNQENYIFFNLPADGVDGGPEWSLPADDVQTNQLIFLPHLHHSDSCPRSCQRCVHCGRRVPWLLAQPEEFHLSTGTGKVLCVALCMCNSVWVVHNEAFPSPVCLSASSDPLSGMYGFSTGLFSLYKGMKEKFMCTGLCFDDTARRKYLTFFVCTSFFKLDSELAPLSGMFQKYTGSSQDPISRAVDATQEEVCIFSLLL